MVATAVVMTADCLTDPVPAAAAAVAAAAAPAVWERIVAAAVVVTCHRHWRVSGIDLRHQQVLLQAHAGQRMTEGRAQRKSSRQLSAHLLRLSSQTPVDG